MCRDWLLENVKLVNSASGTWRRGNGGRVLPEDGYCQYPKHVRVVISYLLWSITNKIQRYTIYLFLQNAPTHPR